MSSVPIHAVPSSPDPSSKPASLPTLSAEERGKLETLIRHLNEPGLLLPSTVKDVKSAQKYRQKQYRDVGGWVGKSLDRDSSGSLNDCKGLSDREKCLLTSERERILISPQAGSQTLKCCALQSYSGSYEL